MAGNVAYLRSEQRIDSKWHARWRWRAFQESTKVIGTLGMIPNEEKLNFILTDTLAVTLPVTLNLTRSSIQEDFEIDHLKE